MSKLSVTEFSAAHRMSHIPSLFFISFPSDINECERPSNCQRGHCINSMGSYHCECQKGYTLVGGRRCQGQSLHIFKVRPLSEQNAVFNLPVINSYAGTGEFLLLSISLFLSSLPKNYGC